MATPNEIITMINTELPTNGNNEITASVLRPVLIAMVNQINGLVGNASGLPGGSNTVIEAINNSTSSGITILNGTTDPNVTPPSSFNLGDFYTQTSGSVLIGFWQFNGILWAEIISRQQQKIRNTRYITSSSSINDIDDILIYKGASISDVITLPDATLSNGRIIVLVSLSSSSIKTSVTYNSVNGSTDEFNSGTVLMLVSDGTNYVQINTIDTI